MTGDVDKSDPIHTALKAAVEVPTHRYLWTPADGIDFVPAVCSRVFGDGRALLALTTINSRPRYYVVRIDSSWQIDEYGAPNNAPHLRDHLDEIYDALLEQFGPADYEDEDEDEELGPERREWPAFDDENGTAWGRLDWPDGVAETEPHPWDHVTILKREAATP